MRIRLTRKKGAGPIDAAGKIGQDGKKIFSHAQRETNALGNLVTACCAAMISQAGAVSMILCAGAEMSWNGTAIQPEG
ncbi:hypothetical protein [Jiella mangrovi]|uniref:Uncharacterized protein n=1 Tax=Jiella mangrovi TaxID=2821407 RepID=A0ABS4BC34_9HYPH|nr:hypothetical protein [Jiella mangrovi]MBP0614321.1 hypothetical protein [Jiella mangrovi]